MRNRSFRRAVMPWWHINCCDVTYTSI